MARFALVLTALFVSITNLTASVIVQTDTTWRATETTPAAGWNTSLSFNDSSWGPAYIVYPQFPSFGPNIAGGPTDRGALDTWLRKTFTLTAVPITPTMNWFFDDDGEVYINGTLVYADASGLANNVAVGLDVSPFLVVGNNLIAAHIHNTAGGYRYAGGIINANGFAAPPVAVPPIAVPEPSSLILLGVSGILLWAGAGRRREQVCPVVSQDRS